MDEIKQHLESGKTVKEIVELGFKKPSVYKCRKELKDKEPPEVKEDPKPPEDTKPFQKENEEVFGTVLDNNITRLDNSGTPPSNLPNTQEEEEENDGLAQELFGDDKAPFRDFNEVDINRDHIDINPHSSLSKSDTKPPDGGTGQLGLNELIAQVFGTIAVATDHEHWELSSKDQKVLKHLCKIPALEKALHKFGLYGCVLSLITMTFKRIKTEMQFKRENQEYENYDQENRPEPITRPDSPGTVMDLFGKEE